MKVPGSLMPARSGGRMEFKANGKTIVISNPDKVLYPENGFTQSQVVQYYADVQVSGAKRFRLLVGVPSK